MSNHAHPNNLKQYRIRRNLTQDQVVAVLQLKSTNKLSRWEAGKAYPSVANALRLAKLFEVTVEDLYKSK